LNFIFRFPIADLQPLSKRRPWWIQAVHKEILIFDFKQMNFQSDFLTNEATSLAITSEAIQGKLYHKKTFFGNIFVDLVYYMANNNSDRSHIAQISSSNGEIIK
jgi:hypothetical protein